MDSDSPRASLESFKDDDSECAHVSNEPNLEETCGGGSSVGGEGVRDVNSSAAASELVPPEPVSADENGEGAGLNSVPEIGDVVEGGAPVDVVVSSELSPVVGRGGGEDAAFDVQERDSVGGEATAVEPSSVVGEGGEEEGTASIVRKGDFSVEGSDSKANLSGDRPEENKEVSMEEEHPSHDLSGYEVNGVDSLNAEVKREEGEQVVCGGVAGEESSQAIESELGENTESEKEKVDLMEEETAAQAASLVNDIEIPDDKEVACENEFVEEEPVKEELQIGEGAKDLTDGDAKEGVDGIEDAMDIQVLKKSEEEEKLDGAAVSDIETKPQEMDDVATVVSEKTAVPVDISSAVVTQFAGETSNDKEIIKNDVKEDAENDSEAGKSLDIHVPEAAEEVETDVKYGDGIEKEGDGLGGEGKAGQTVDLDESREENQELSHEVAKVDETKISEVSEEAEPMIGDADKEKDDDMTDLAEDMETHGDSSVADIEQGREDHEDMGLTEMTETQEETAMGKVDGTNIAEVSEETETRIEDRGQGKDDVMTDVAEDVVTHGDSSLADIEEGKKNHEDITDTLEESVTAEMGDEDPEDVDEETKSAGGKRKRGRNTKTVKGTGKKKEEDVCFMCFDGGDLVLCDRRGCPKAYHPSCVDRDEAFFQSKGKWNCGWHLCSKCEKAATYLCYTCMFSLCKGCAKDAVFFCIRGNKGLCETCMETVKLIERKEQEKEPAQLDFDDKTSWEYLFKDYWIDLKTQLSLSPEELDQAKSPRKGQESNASKQGTASETDYVTDGGSDSDSSPKKRKTRSRSKSGSPANKNFSGETTEWASKELLDVVVHMRRGDRSFVPESDVQNLLLAYIKRYNLRDPRRKSQVICDSRLQNLFGKSHVGHFEMLNLLDSHLLKKEQNQSDDIQSDIADTEEPNHVDVDENSDHPMKSGKDKKRKTRKKSVRKGRQSNLDDFAAVDLHNINLIYLRRSLVEDLLEDSAAFEEKVASAFVRLRISGNQKQDIYRLVQVVGTSKAPEPYKVGKKTTDFVLEILNLDKTEVVSIDIISNQDFTEDECKRLKQSIKCGLINRLTVGGIQEKAIALQEVRVKNLLEAEILRFSHLRDRASDMGRRKELRECVEKLQLLKSPEERQRRLEEIPEIHADPKMDPDCESEDEDEKEEMEKEKQLRPRSSSFNRRGRDPISPRKGGFSSNESWTGTSKYSKTSANRELSRSYSGRGSNGRGDYLGSSDDMVSENMWPSAREREVQPSLGSEKPRSVTIPETTPRSSRAVAPPELSPRIAPEIPTAPPAVVQQPVPKSNESEKIWHYKDPSGKVQGPFSMAQLRKWNNTGYFPAKLEIWKAKESPLDSILLTDALAGLFQKQTQAVNNSYTNTQVAAYSGQSSQSDSNLGSTARTAPTIEIPRNSQDTWSQGGSLPSPTPNQITTPTAKRRNFESRWSPTKHSPPSPNQLMNYAVAQSGQSQASRIDGPVVVHSAGALQPQTYPIPTSDSINASVIHPATLPSPTPTGGKQSWGSMQTDHRGSDALSSQNSSTSYGTTNPSVLPSQSQPGFPPSDSWKVAAPSQPNPQAQTHWGMNMVNNQNSGQLQAPANQNSSWGQGTVNPNMGWVGPAQAGGNVNWAGSSVPSTGQGIPNSGWGGPVQGQPQAYPNPGWGVTAVPQAQAQSQAQVQAPVSTTGAGWIQPGQGMQSGNNNQNWGTQHQMAIPSGGSGGNQAGYWGNQQNQNGDSGYGWNRQSSGSGGQNNNFKGQRVCKFFRENGHCRKGASCNYLHN
ncbi:PREDICTED: zinc finger CCCH domain-containing protein 19-like isoform X1 [Camelina sativa]|uniref:Zinc finger CCCH domain-containing protein 19-like isoform X1 n=1 Tax=Camelina sativa TaxID=90675 RepID=A0ABM1QAZ5_CAMSA|nr:PREDICTED: zinc finger CCCH domain-containing protein 19-like isoform X1 [Camelina sativa]XP_019083932.1 PREDICTED: zinc finger CCCH domain-containing protein 19-like isoform X3 [Camelina sativa]XP_019083933.1 PREDICTED: zinc finger CCCH domain-containing protein 19-like isoform X1 [Camelina sativa]